MGDLSRNFSKKEFACKCGCGCDQVDRVLVAGLQAIRDHFKKPVIVLSGLRCEEHNRKTKGAAEGSQHLLGKAADICINGIAPEEIARFAVTLEAFRNGGIGVYGTFVHLDVRGRTARWGEPWKE